VISEVCVGDVGSEFRLYFANVSGQPLTVRNKNMSVALAGLQPLYLECQAGKIAVSPGTAPGHTIPLSTVAGCLRCTVAGKLRFARNGCRFLESG
jgi:hypothetical protein